ncbi:glucosamine-6-phosphate deaminase [soil metagenome]
MSVLDDIVSQPAAWTEALGTVRQHAPAIARLSEGRFADIVYTGCGSTFFLTVAAATLHQRLTDEPARAVPAGEIMLEPGQLAAETLMFAISRSGRTTETVRAVDVHAGLESGKLVTITCRPGSLLASHSDIEITLPKAYESNVAQTRSFASMWMATTAMIAAYAGQAEIINDLDSMPAACSALIKRFRPVMRELGTSLEIDRIYVLGSGVRYGLACEGALLLKEVALTHAEAFHFLEFRHGPTAMVTPQTLIVGLLNSRTDQLEIDVVRDALRIGARTLLLGDDPVDLPGALTVDFGVGSHPLASTGLYLPVLQLLAFERAVAKGLDPQHPPNLSAVIDLDPHT